LNIHVVLVEDSEDDFVIVRGLLASIEHFSVQLTWAPTYDAGIAALGKPHDISLVDYRLGARDGLELIRTLMGRGHREPIILMTGEGDHEIDLRAMEAGAADYLSKEELASALLERSIRYALQRKRAELDLKDSEKKLEQSVSLLRATLESTVDGILVTSDREVVNFNRRFLDLWHIPAQSVATELALDAPAIVDHLRDSASYREKLAHLTAHPEVESDDVLELHDGRIFERHSRPQVSGGSIVGRVWSFRDITEQRKMQVGLVAADRLASMGTIAAGVAHEINNPLAYITANLALLAEQIPKLGTLTGPGGLGDVMDILKDVREGAERVRKVVRDLKVFTRTDDVATGPLEIRSVLELAINIAFSEIRHRSRLVKDYGVGVPLVDGNEGKLGQVFLNLLVNAAHAIEAGDVDHNEIRVVTRVDTSGRVVVEIHDTGEGISPDKLTQIFAPFYTSKPIGVGTGLGLSISQSIVTSLGGTIEVRSELGKGSVFTVALVPARADREAVAVRSNEVASPNRRGNILVVDDDKLVAKVMLRVLGNEHDVTVVASGREALEHLSSAERVDLILCDLMMPDMTGMALHEHLARARPVDADKMIFLTGGAFTSDARDFLDRIAKDKWLEKPFNPETVRRAVQRALALAEAPTDARAEVRPQESGAPN